MGSLAFAVGGGIEGLGKGMNEVGTEQIQAQRQQAIERMKQNFEQEQQQRGFTEQEKLQGKTQEFEKGQKEREYQVGMMSASAGRQFEAGQQTEKLHSEEQRTHETAQSRENAALIRAAGAAGNRGAAKAGGEWKAQPVNAGPATKPDGTPDYGAPPHQVMGLVNSRTGAIYNPQGNRLYAWDNDKMQSLRDPKSTNNSVKPGEVEDLLRDPLGTIPDGPNQGLRKSDVFEQAHGYLPKPFIDAATRASQPPQGAGGNPVKLLGGQTVNVPSGGGSQGPEPADPSDMQTD
jgi:hypothetical protein